MQQREEIKGQNVDLKNQKTKEIVFQLKDLDRMLQIIILMEFE